MRCIARNEVSAAADALTRAFHAQDRALLDKLLHPDLTFGHASGMLQSKSELIQAVMDGKFSRTSEFMERTVRVYGDTALVRAATGQFKFLHVWLKGPEGWKLIAQQATRLK